MKKILKAAAVTMVFGSVFCAAPARAQTYIDMPPVAPGELYEAGAGKLSGAAARISASVLSGDNAAAGQLLAGLFSGAVSRAPAAVPAYARSATAAPVQPALPAGDPASLSVIGGVVPELSDVNDVPAVQEEEEEEEEEEDSAGAAPAVSETYQNAYERTSAASREAGVALGGQFLGGGIGIILVLLLICLL
jgi:hypothetical protein